MLAGWRSKCLRSSLSETPDTIVAYRHGHRWLPIVEQTPMVSGGGHQFQRGGVYVITHALQEIGFALAEHLVREFECKVVMLARSFFPRPQEWDQWVREQGDNDPISRSIARLQGIRESLTVLSADVSDPERLKRIKAQIERERGRRARRASSRQGGKNRTHSG